MDTFTSLICIGCITEVFRNIHRVFEYWIFLTYGYECAPCLKYSCNIDNNRFYTSSYLFEVHHCIIYSCMHILNTEQPSEFPNYVLLICSTFDANGVNKCFLYISLKRDPNGIIIIIGTKFLAFDIQSNCTSV